MPPKRQVVAANERKAAQEEAKNAAAAAKKEQEEAEAWGKGAKANKKEDEERKKQEAAAKKAEREALLAAEEAEFSKKKPTNAKGAQKPATMSSMVQKMALGMGGGGSAAAADGTLDTYAASGIDAALDLLDLTTKKGNIPASDAIDKHPERRMKSAWAAFEERELPILKAENPTLRLSQLKQLLQKKWKKSPENPMNAELVGTYDMTAQEVRDAVTAKRDENLEKMKV